MWDGKQACAGAGCAMGPTLGCGQEHARTRARETRDIMTASVCGCVRAFVTVCACVMGSVSL